ncbi:MAG: caspase family protein, partial [Paludibacteraceae bacterium]|nr:caspase family protein [Paludibacteraceae bacterium]
HENATYNDMRLAIAWLKNVCEKYEGEASVIFYYAGHGIPDPSDKSAYLLPTDGDGRYVATGYKLDVLYQKLGDMPAKSIVVMMDACFSGANRDGNMLASERGVALKSKSGMPRGNMVVLSAAQGDETALPNEDEGHGMFTYYVLKKLQESKGETTLQELSQYVIREVGRKTAVENKPQTPCVTPSVSLGNDWQSWKLK